MGRDCIFYRIVSMLDHETAELEPFVPNSPAFYFQNIEYTGPILNAKR